MTKAIEPKKLNKAQLIAEIGGVIIEHKNLDKKIATSFHTSSLKAILSDKKKLKDLTQKVNSYRGRLKKLGVVFDEYGNIIES